jgi:lysophospholipase L1-like esterase
MNVGSKFKKWNLDRDAYQRTNNELMKEFIPNYKTTFKGDTLYTNSFGLRDKEYSLEKATGVVRLAFVGGSYIMGSGVSNEENFAAVVEEKLNSGNKKIEVLNYGVGGYFLIQSVFVVQNKVPKYKPDYLFLFIHSSYRVRCLDNFANLLMKNISITDPYLKAVAAKAGIKKGMCHLEIYDRLKPYGDEIITWGYRTMYETCKNENIIPVMVYLPANAALKEDNDKEFCFSEATKLGFYTMDLSGVYSGQDPEKIQLSSWDTHPNEKGHQLISDLLLEKLKKDKQFFKFMD